MKDTVYIGVDGEGVEGHSPTDPHHKYVLLAASSADSETSWYVEDPAGLSTETCLRFLVELPQARHKLFAYSFNYDLTKILEDVDDQSLYLLFRPELRQRKGEAAKHGPWPILWRDFSLNLQGTKFTVSDARRKVVLWDIWKFYQSKFVGALKDWKVGHEALYDRMSAMKNRRASFRLEDMEEVRRYCLEECACMGQLAEKLVTAHEAAGLKLNTFYGAGSSATAMMKVMGIKDKLRPVPDEILRPVACAFFGGRFENSILGAYGQRVYNYDISSAYPYQTCFLPCLVHGSWHHTTDLRDVLKARAALVHYAMIAKAPCEDWAPFPFREGDGSICYPKFSEGGWVYRDEFLAGRAGWPDLVTFREAWVFDTDCDCQPFQDVPAYYRERVRIGKEGPGMVIKLGCNSLYGKLAQSVGSSPFNNWIWAGMITSGCRAQMLELMAKVADRRDILMIATDGCQVKSRITPPRPRDTGTWACSKDGKAVPLGGWEEEEVPQGVFYARPGIYFPLNPDSKMLKKVKGRGVGKKVVLDNSERIRTSYENHGPKVPVVVRGIERFCGGKTSISFAEAKAEFHRATSSWTQDEDGLWLRRLPAYGEWIAREVVMSFDPMPKRSHVLGGTHRLALRSIETGLESAPYRKAYGGEDAASDSSDDAVAMRAEAMVLSEQPDVDYSEMVDLGL